jgi:hypothetical protein
MLGNIRTLWQETRATRLKEEFLDMMRRTNAFTEETAEHFGKTIDYAFKHWIANHGPVKECPIEFRKSAAKELKAQAKQRYSTDLGASYGLTLFAAHIEASYLPGDDASFVYDLTTHAISVAQKIASENAS